MTRGQLAQLPPFQRYHCPSRPAPWLLLHGRYTRRAAPDEREPGSTGPSPAFDRLEEAAWAEDIPTFVRLADEIDWRQMSADRLAEAIRLALLLPAHNTAHRLAALGGELHPSHPYLAKAARTLLPPKPPPAEYEAMAARTRADALSSLLHEWLTDESGYDEATWPELTQALERIRTSDRRLFGE